MDLEFLRYPIGKFEKPENIGESQVRGWISEVESLPELLSNAAILKVDKLDMPYRPGGWTLRQVVHHVADSHMNAYIRFKLALTEDNPVIKPYFEDRWAELEDAKHADVDISLALLKALHQRWVLFMRSLTDVDWNKTYYHPESKNSMPLKEVVGMYAWHGKHHLHHLLNTD